MENAVRWSIRVAKETDTVLRSYLARQGGKRGDLAKFVDEAVRWRVLDMTVRTIRERNKEIPEGEIQDVIDKALAATRGKRRARHKHRR
jgi:hypothetical protein